MLSQFNPEELIKHNVAWQQAKAEIAKLYPYDTNFGRDVPPSLFSKIAQRAEEIRRGSK